MMSNISAIHEIVLILFMTILLNGFFAPISNISLVQTNIDAYATNSTDSFLTYEDTTNGFKMRYPSDWNKTNYPPFIPIAGFMSPAQNATDKLFENIIVAVESLPAQNTTLDHYSHSLIEQLELSYPEFDVVSPPKETVLGGVPAYNMTFTSKRADQNNPSVVYELKIMQIWAVENGKAYIVTYGGTQSQYNYSLTKAQKMIDSFSFVPSRQTPFLTEFEKTGDRFGDSGNITNAETNTTALSSFSTYENATYGIRIQYPSNWIIEEEVLEKDIQEYALNDDFYTVVNFRPPSENGSYSSFGLGVGIEKLPFQESTMDGYIQEAIDLFKPPYYTDLNIIELNSSSSLGGRPAFKYIFSYLENGIKQTYLQAGTIISGKVYYIFFSAPEQKFSQYLSVVQKLIGSFEIAPTDKPASPLTVDEKVEFLTYENFTLGLKMQYPSNSKLIDNTSDGISFALPDEVSESLYDILFVQVVPLPYAVSKSAFIDRYIPIWVSQMKENLTNFSLTKSRASALDDSPAQRLEYTYAKKDNPEVELRALSILAAEDDILYHIWYKPLDTFSYSDHIPIIERMIESFEISKKGIPNTEDSRSGL